jgi:hypothetical protein
MQRMMPLRVLERASGELLFLGAVGARHKLKRGNWPGEALLPHARAALAAAERGRDTIASLRGVLHGRLRIGVAGPVGDDDYRTVARLAFRRPR